MVVGFLGLIGGGAAAAMTAGDKEPDLKPAGLAAAAGLVLALVGVVTEDSGRHLLRAGVLRTCP